MFALVGSEYCTAYDMWKHCVDPPIIVHKRKRETRKFREATMQARPVGSACPCQQKGQDDEVVSAIAMTSGCLWRFFPSRMHCLPAAATGAPFPSFGLRHLQGLPQAGCLHPEAPTLQPLQEDEWYHEPLTFRAPWTASRLRFRARAPKQEVSLVLLLLLLLLLLFLHAVQAAPQ